MALRLYLLPVVELPPGSTLRHCLAFLHLGHPRPDRWYRFADDAERHVSVALVNAPDALHDAILADPRGAVPLGPAVPDLATFRALLDARVGVLSPGHVAAVKARAEAWGANTAWIDAATPIRAVLRYLVCRFRFSTEAHDEPAVQSFAARSPDLTTASTPKAERDAVAAYLARKGMPSGFLAADIRATIHNIVGARMQVPAKLGDEAV